MSEWFTERYRFESADDNHRKIVHDVYAKGEGPPILILQELPGIGPETLALADRLIAAGFSVHLPHLFGRFGRANKLTILSNAIQICIRREFRLFLHGRQSPIAAWMRGLCAEIRKRTNSHVGVIGMCLTGSFAIPLMAEDAVVGAVASQPSLPIFPAAKLHMSQEDVSLACDAMSQKGCAVAMRYADDHISKPEHMRALKTAFGEHLNVMEFKGAKHCLLTLEFHGRAYKFVEEYFKERLKSS